MLVPVTTDAVTVIVVQRVSTIVRADQILVLEEGRIVGLGTHRELLESCLDRPLMSLPRWSARPASK